MGVGFIDAKQEQKEAILPINYTHILILGETGSGKTTGIINPNIKHRIKEGHGVLVFDYKGHYHTHIKALAKQCGRLEDVIMIGEPWGENINILSLLNENGIEEILNVLLFNDGKNTFWERSAINLAIEILTAIIGRNKDNLKQEYRNLINEIGQIDESKLRWIGLENIFYSFNSTLSKMAGSYMKLGEISAILNPEKDISDLEHVVRE